MRFLLLLQLHRQSFLNKDFLQISLKKNFSNFLYISFFSIKLENLTVKFHVLYVFNMYIKFRLNLILFIIRSINLFFIHDFRS